MVLDDPSFDGQWLHAAGHSGAGGAELGECLAVGCPRSSPPRWLNPARQDRLVTDRRSDRSRLRRAPHAARNGIERRPDREEAAHSAREAGGFLARPASPMTV
jgi:hypothetical protein